MPFPEATPLRIALDKDGKIDLGLSLGLMSPLLGLLAGQIIERMLEARGPIAPNLNTAPLSPEQASQERILQELKREGRA